MKSKALFILHLPQPVHGSSIVGKQIKDSNIINQSFDCYYINLNTSSSINSIGKFSLLKIKIYFDILFKVINVLIVNKFDVIYMAPTVSKGGALKDGFIIFFINLFKKNSRVFLHLHNKGASERKSFFWKKWYKIFFKDKKVILLSKRLYKDVSEYVAEEDVFVCPNGIKKIPEKIKYNNDKFTILFLSNLIKDKGILDLIDACEILKNKGYNFQCNIVGGEGNISKEDLILLINEKSLDKYVFYLGKKYDEEKNIIFQKSDIFILPTYNETFGIVNIEAMQFSIPIISTNVGGIPDIVEDGVNGFIVDTHSPIQIADKICYFIDNPEEIIRMGENGYNKFLENFTSSVFEKRLLEILNS